ncbi:hypothetical protein SCAR479_11353 [Seiridium cardinale]|uniref:Uncharacterized protein n=1 Tax=Seiridium cardinale TaxID=138064 RepID=A0ABR2XE24_9PEZI
MLRPVSRNKGLTRFGEMIDAQRTSIAKALHTATDDSLPLTSQVESIMTVLCHGTEHEWKARHHHQSFSCSRLMQQYNPLGINLDD